MAFALCAAQGGKCFYCEVMFTGPVAPKAADLRATQWTRDHLLPKCNGHGRIRNIILACVRCNSKKGKRSATLQEMERAAEVWKRAGIVFGAFMGEVPEEWKPGFQQIMNRPPTAHDKVMGFVQRPSGGWGDGN